MNVQKVIKSHGWTLERVAKQLKNQRGGIGISQGALSTALNGNPTIDKLQEIATVIGVSLSELVADEKENAGIKGVCPHCGKPINVTLS